MRLGGYSMKEDQFNDLMEEGNFEEIIKLLNPLLEKDSNNLYFLLWMGSAYSGLNDHEKAIEFYDKILEIEPNLPYVKYKKASVLILMGDYDAASRLAKSLLNTKTDDRIFYYDLGYLFEYLEDYDNAIKSYEAGLVLNSKDTAFLFALGQASQLKLTKEAIKEAIKYYDNCLKIDPDFLDAMISKANALDLSGKHHEALQLIDNALERKPEDGRALSIKGMILYSLKHFDDALNYFKASLEKEDYVNGKVVNWIRMTLNRLDRKDEAKIYEKMLEDCDDILLEKSLEKRIIKDIGLLKKVGYDLKIIKNQYKCKDRNAYIDILCEDKKTGDYVVIELKTLLAEKETYNQINNYLDCIKNTIAKDKGVRGLVISKWFDEEFKNLCKENEEISYLELKKLGL